MDENEVEFISVQLGGYWWNDKEWRWLSGWQQSDDRGVGKRKYGEVDRRVLTGTNLYTYIREHNNRNIYISKYAVLGWLVLVRLRYGMKVDDQQKK